MCKFMYECCHVVPRKGRGRKKTDKEAAFDRLDAIITASRTLPTVVLFDGVWHAAFAWLQKISKSCGISANDIFQATRPSQPAAPVLVRRASVARDQLWIWLRHPDVGELPLVVAGSCETEHPCRPTSTLRPDGKALSRRLEREVCLVGSPGFSDVAAMPRAGVVEWPSPSYCRAVAGRGFLEQPRTETMRVSQLLQKSTGGRTPQP